MAFQETEVQTLSRLGLNSTQARVYLALLRSGESTVATISSVSKVARQDIYRVLSALQKLGLVEKIITAPAMFKAVPLAVGLNILMERRIKETSELQEKTREILQSFKENYSKETFQEAEHQFIMIPEKEAQVLRAKEAIRISQRRVGIITSWRKFLQIMPLCDEAFQEAMRNGAKIRLITQKPESAESLPEIVQALKKNPSFKVRYTLAAPEAHVALFDKREVFINTSVKDDLAAAPFLWSNNPYLTAIIQDYFDIMWITSMEKIPKEP